MQADEPTYFFLQGEPAHEQCVPVPDPEVFTFDGRRTQTMVYDGHGLRIDAPETLPLGIEHSTSYVYGADGKLSFVWEGREIDIDMALKYHRCRVYDSHVGVWLDEDGKGPVRAD